jgi:hypothetical protein
MDSGEAMARVFYVTDGSYPRNFVDLGRRVSVEVLERQLQGQDLRYLSTLPPEFNRERPSPEVKYGVFCSTPKKVYFKNAPPERPCEPFPKYLMFQNLNDYLRIES